MSSENSDEEEEVTEKVECVPCMKNKCCFGCFTLRQAAFLVAMCEIIALLLFFVETIYLVFKNGDVFYTKELQGKGTEIALINAFLCALSAFAVSSLIIGASKKRHEFVLFHLIYQILVISILSCMLWAINDRMENENPEIIILAPSAITLTVFFAIPAVLEVWWFFIVLDLYINLLCSIRNVHTRCEATVVLDFE